LWAKLEGKNAESFISDLKARGHDGIVLDDSEFGGKSFVAFEPNQIKSADAVTYDDAGNVIPLSQRFNQQREDIRYSRAPAAPGTPVMDEKRTTGEKAREKFLDSDAPFRDLQDEVGGVKEVVRADGYTDHRTSTDFVAAKDKYNGRLEHEMRGLQRRVDEVNADLDAARLDAQKSDAGTEELLKENRRGQTPPAPSNRIIGFLLSFVMFHVNTPVRDAYLIRPQQYRGIEEQFAKRHIARVANPHALSNTKTRYQQLLLLLHSIIFSAISDTN
jgi:hypothetical protein